MLLVSFLLGLWLGWMLWNRYKQLADQLRLDNDSLRMTANTLQADKTDIQNKLKNAEGDNTALALRIQGFEDDKNQQQERLLVLNNDIQSLQQRNHALETELALAASAEETRGGGIVALEAADAPDAGVPSILVKGTDSYEAYRAEVEAASDAFKEAAEHEANVAADAAVLQNIPSEVDSIPFEVVTDADEEDVPYVEPLPLAHNPALQPEVITVPVAREEEILDNEDLEHLDEPATPTPVFIGEQDDLKIVEGIGPKIEALLHEQGIHTYSDLAGTSVGRLKEILQAAGPRFSLHDPGTWSAQALLAANGEWDNLKAYQDFLNSGKRPNK